MDRPSIKTRGRVSRLSTTWAVFSLVLAALATGREAAAQCNYEVTAIIQAPECPIIGPPPTIATGISELGHVVGYYQQCNIGDEAFLWTPQSGVTTLPRPVGVNSAQAADISDAGVIVGTYTVTNVGFRGFVYEDGGYTELAPAPPGLWSMAFAINNARQAVGYRSIDGVWPETAFVWGEFAGFTDLGVMNGPSSSAAGINEMGHVVGWTGNGGNVSEAFLWKDGALTLLGSVPGGFTSSASAISENSVVVGSGRIPMKGAPVGATRAFRWQRSEFTMLGTLPDHTRSHAWDISPDGWQIVGRSRNVDGNPNISHGFIWQNGVMTDLNQLIPSDLGLVVTSANAINASGWITGRAHAGFGLTVVGVLLKPIDPPIGDIDRDCEVGVADLIILLDTFGDAGSVPADLNADGVVNVLDLIILLLNFG